MREREKAHNEKILDDLEENWEFHEEVRMLRKLSLERMNVKSLESFAKFIQGYDISSWENVHLSLLIYGEIKLFIRSPLIDHARIIFDPSGTLVLSARTEDFSETVTGNLSYAIAWKIMDHFNSLAKKP